MLEKESQITHAPQTQPANTLNELYVFIFRPKRNTGRTRINRQSATVVLVVCKTKKQLVIADFKVVSNKQINTQFTF